ncbi:MAG: nitroreductase [Dehalococcoidia bacterium]|nr:nitroreductase [Dehalococcoidia bacterium]
MDVLDALRTRRTVGAFAPELPPFEAVERAIEAATWAPNHHLTEPWRFHVFTGAGRAELAAAAGTTLPPDRDTDEERAAIRAKFERAPVLVVVTQAGGDGDAVRDLEDYAACACATQNLLLAAHAQGLAAKWSTGKLARSEGVQQRLGLAEGDRIVAFVYLGYAAADAAAAPRRSPPQITRYG